MVKVKICGLTKVEDAKTAHDAGADLIGVIVNAKVPTPRSLNYDGARKILDQAPSGVEKVAVGMPEDLSEGLEIIEELNPDYLQMHSYPSLSEVKELKETTGKKLIITVSVPHKVTDPEEIIARAEEIAELTDFILLDTKGPGGGGTGRTHNWGTSRKIRDALDTPLFLAGGLTPSNVREAIEKVQPYGVDVASGVELEPGVKDPEKLQAFIENSKKA